MSGDKVPSDCPGNAVPISGAAEKPQSEQALSRQDDEWRLDQKQLDPPEEPRSVARLHEQKQQPSPHPASHPDTSAPYSSFTLRKKRLIVLCATLGGLFSPFTANIYYPALSTIASDLGVSISKVNLTITTYMIFQAIAPSFMSSVTDTHGRRPAYMIGFIIYLAANVGLAVNNSYAGLLVLRCLQSSGSSALITLQQATIVDVITSAERGSYISITSITSVVAPSVAPIVGGVLSQHFGWHSVFYFLLIMSGVYLVPLLVWFPETSRKIVGDGSIPAHGWNQSLVQILRKRSAKAGIDETSADPNDRPRKGFAWPNPLPTLAVFRDWETCLLLFFASVVYAAFYAISSSLTVQFHVIYGLNDTLQGLLFIPQAVGSLFSAITNSILLDRNYRRLALKHGFGADRKRQADLTNFPIEAARLQIAIPMFAANSLCIIAYGWMLSARVHIAGPIVMLALNGYTLLAGFNALSVLNLDINRHRAASASAASNLSRCLFGAAMTALINPMIEAMGLGWTFTLIALIQLSLVPTLWLLVKNGIKWRARMAARNEKRSIRG